MNADRFKFRVWDKENEGYQEKDADFCAIRYDGTLHCDFWGDGDTRPPEHVSNQDAIIEQCTGLRDKNGKLIYEGDIVIIPNQYPFYDYAEGVAHKDLNATYGQIEHDAELNYIAIVEWSDLSASFSLELKCVNSKKRGISDGITEYIEDPEVLEVIGNIHEEAGR